MTPMQKQYNEIKKEYSDAVLLFRLGDFFEAFNEDAELLSNILGITLTGRGKGEKRTPMAGIPHHALKNYLPKLVEKGLKVAIADQVEEAVQGQLVERKVTQIITAGTIIDEDTLDSSKNNYLAAVIREENEYLLAFTDITTGEFKVFKSRDVNSCIRELNKINPSELLINDSVEIDTSRFNRIEKVNDTKNIRENLEYLKNHFDLKTLEGFGLKDNDKLINVAAILLRYIKNNHKEDLNHIHNISIYNFSDYMQLDSETINNLELLYPLNTSGDINATVYSILNNAITSMGQRLLRVWIVNPLVNSEMLQERLDSVEYFFKDSLLNSDTRDLLKGIYDFERIAGRIGFRTINPKDLIALKNSLENSLGLLDKLQNSELPLRLKYLTNVENTEEIQAVITKIGNTIVEEPSTVIGEGIVVKEGVDSEIDEYRSLKNNSKKILLEIQQRESSAHGIPSLKVSFNKVFGYYIEVTKTHGDKVPNNYVRKQTLTNAERYITEELKEIEDKIFSAEDKLFTKETEIFNNLILEIERSLDVILEFSKKIAEIDVLSCFGFNSRQMSLVKPEIVTENFLNIKNGRHIVVEKISNHFISNDTEFNNDSKIHILTGPNMSGKSTYIRQVALITLLAQIGSFVPASEMQFSIVDRIFTRVGATDNLAKGQSTFMMEMIETANIINNATEKSLIILDEVGRGTSTYDGVAIAWSIVEYLITKIKAKTLFATHYHELISLSEKFSDLENYNVSVNEKNGEITFQYKIVKGGTDKSYGVHVGKIAGLPKEVTDRAEEILSKFEATNVGTNIKNNQTKSKKITPKSVNPEQLGLL